MGVSAAYKKSKIFKRSPTRIGEWRGDYGPSGDAQGL